MQYESGGTEMADRGALEAIIETLEENGFCGPMRKKARCHFDEEYDFRDYQQAASSCAYAKDLCTYRFCVNPKSMPRSPRVLC